MKEVLDDIVMSEAPKEPKSGWVYGVLLLLQFLGMTVLPPRGNNGMDAGNRVVLALVTISVCWGISALMGVISRIFVSRGYPIRSRRFLVRNVLGGFTVWIGLMAFLWLFLIV